ncbi:proline dehydrogenase family protein [Candidatus Micrarchaeota archaeon]|nr:proline dehydrogenase family protein [Candidatus Micrarchaeota archaeon]
MLQEKRWIAGYTLASGVARCRALNRHGVRCLINFLGEHCKDVESCDFGVSEYSRVIRAIKNNKLDAAISFKLSQLGLGFSAGLALRNAERIISLAEKSGVFCWLDGEKSELTGREQKVFLKLRAKHANVGIALIAGLRDAPRQLAKLGDTPVRLVKGAYEEQESVAFTTRREIDAAFGELMRLLFQRGGRFAVATHDPAFLKQAFELEKENKKAKVEYQFLFGVDDARFLKLARSHCIVFYVPYGLEFHHYVRRRLEEQRRFRQTSKQLVRHL